MNAPLDLDWTSANQRLLVAGLALLRARLGEGDIAEAGQQVEAAAQRLPAPSAIDTLAALFELSDFERNVLLLTAGVDMDARLAALCGEAAGQPQRQWATFSLALAALPDPHWSALTPLAPLRRWRLVEVTTAPASPLPACASTSGCCTSSPGSTTSTTALPPCSTPCPRPA